MNEMVLNLREGRCPNPGNALIRAVRRLPPRQFGEFGFRCCGLCHEHGSHVCVLTRKANR
jgi:hypothetical protein